jgi:hypothetical protein
MDVMLALIMAVAFIVATLYLVTTPKLETEEYLYKVGTDVLTIADKDGSLRGAVSGDPQGANELLYSMPSSLCLNLTITSPNDAIVYSENTGCPDHYKQVIVRRTVMNNTGQFIAKLRIWRS